MRIKRSLGKQYHNPGCVDVYDDEKYTFDNTRSYYLFDVIPCPAPRMTRSDKWNKRPIVTRYFAFRDLLALEANQMGYKMGDRLEAVFFVPMPDSWSEKKKERMNGMPCKTQPDLDNYIKAFCDAMSKKDGNVWNAVCQKRYAYTGAILVYQT